MKNLKFMLLSIMAVFMVSSCTHDIEYNPQTAEQVIVAKYNQAFVKTFGNPAPNHTWGFSTIGTRAATWTDGHSCNWADKLNVVLPEGATEMTAPGWLSDGVYVVPTDGSVSLGWANFNEGDKIYILGDVTELKEANYNGTVTFYNVGTLTYSVSSGNRHTIINTGTLTINSYGNVGEVYNSGTLNLVKVYNPYYQDPNAKADIPDAMSIFSTGEGSVLMPDGGDFKAAADIHGTLVADANTKIQNNKTQYICGIKVDGALDMTQGHLQASMIEATDIDFDGAEIWLTSGGHIKADVIRMPNSATAIYGEGSSTGLIEVGDIFMGNTNNFEDTFSSNIYFKISGAIDFSNSTKFGGGAKHYNDVAAYNADNTPLKGYNEGDYAEGSPECGQPWTVGTPKEEEPGDEGDDDNYTTFICRVFAEDLSAATGTDFDFNDVVFDVYTNGTDAKVVLLAAGGTIPLFVDGVEVHEAFGVPVSTMVNTGLATATQIKPIVVKGVSTLEDVRDKIKIVVNKDNVLAELTANQGEPAAKFAVEAQPDWADERQDIKTKYSDFESWVHNPTVKWW